MEKLNDVDAKNIEELSLKIYRKLSYEGQTREYIKDVGCKDFIYFNLLITKPILPRRKIVKKISIKTKNYIFHVPTISAYKRQLAEWLAKAEYFDESIYELSENRIEDLEDYGI